MHRRLPNFAKTPKRIVSLVPSMTASLVDLGFGSTLVGITDYCTVPSAVSSIPARVGGPKDARFEDIINLLPDLVIANQEENSRDLIERLGQAGLVVWLTFPKTVRESLDDLWMLVNVFPSKSATLQLRLLEDSLQFIRLALADMPLTPYFCPIWQGQEDDHRLWWMTFNGDTYCSDLLNVCGGKNLFAQHQRRYPLAANWGAEYAEESGDRDVRYPVICEHEIRAAKPEVILLPDEPYPFGEEQKRTILRIFADTPAVRNGRVHLVDGRLITWHGTGLGRSLASLPQYFSPTIF